MSAGITGALVPHAPLLLPDIAGPKISADTETIRRALASLSFDDVDLVIVLSPHARGCGVYGRVDGTLDEFGVSGIELRRPSDPEAVDALAAMWDKPTLPGPVDHGVLVPMMMLATGEIPVVAAGLGEVDDGSGSPGDPVADGSSFARAIGQLSMRHTLFLVASAQTSCALTPRAPLTVLAEAKPAEAAVLSALRGDPAGLQRSASELWQRGGSCSPGTLAAYGEVFAGRSSEVLAYEYPFGVGYVVARVT
ncbi:MAG: hypothetical protein QOG21_1400 [Actinomycetota bacterium]|nr:hypothetical protein [Actinomycetota bacterium]